MVHVSLTLVTQSLKYKEWREQSLCLKFCLQKSTDLSAQFVGIQFYLHYISAVRERVQQPRVLQLPTKNTKIAFTVKTTPSFYLKITQYMSSLKYFFVKGFCYVCPLLGQLGDRGEDASGYLQPARQTTCTRVHEHFVTGFPEYLQRCVRY